MRQCSDRFDPYVRYLKNNNGLVKTAHFIEDFEPIGLQIIADMEEAGIARRMVDDYPKRTKVDDFMLLGVDFGTKDTTVEGVYSTLTEKLTITKITENN